MTQIIDYFSCFNTIFTIFIFRVKEDADLKNRISEMNQTLYCFGLPE